MNDYPIIKKITFNRYEFPLENMRQHILSSCYEPGSKTSRKVISIKIDTDLGISGEYFSIAPGTYDQMRAIATLLIGENGLNRENFYNLAKVILRKQDKMGIGPMDIALWDLAGKYYDTPIFRLLGGNRTKLPAYASTLHGDYSKGGLNSPEAFRDFAEQCYDMGYKAFKIHPWAPADIDQEVKVVNEVGKLSSKMNLMIDPCCEYETYADALRVGRACDENNYFWYEDPLRDGGVSFYAHKKLKQALKTPLLQGEHLHLVETHTDMAIAEATDFWRADPEYDGGITGTMKIAHAAEGFGMDLELHIAGPAQRHCMAAIRNSNYYEMGLLHPQLSNPANIPVYKNDYSDEIDSIDSDGYINVSEDPGLGVEYDYEYAKKFLIDTLVLD